MAVCTACAHSSSDGLTMLAMLSVSGIGRLRLRPTLALLGTNGYGPLLLLLLLLLSLLM